MVFKFMIPYGRQTIDKKDLAAMAAVLKSAYLTQGPKVLEFEAALASYGGAKYAVACTNGTAALHLAYLAAGLKKGDEVITTPNTFAATANMILAVGAKPVFADIRLDTYNIDEKKIERLITKKTKAIVPVHFAGQPCAMADILKIAKKHKLLVIEDACHALGAEYKNKKIGSLGSAMTLFSFHPVKPITTGEGGAILTNDGQLYKKLLSLRNHGIHKDAEGKNIMTDLGYNYRLTDIQAALGVSQLTKLDKFIKARRQIAGWYKQELPSVKQIILPVEAKDNYSGWHIYTIRIVEKKQRDDLASYLKEKGIGVNFHYPAVYSHPYYRDHGFRSFQLPNEEIYWHSCLVLPCYPLLKRSEVKHISRLIKNFYGDKK
ncbi:MAG: UDP-4-keto-6-deoxy-N-acetylglucosamine 4-aminotransferase [Parcubacteria group bacterium GW2011_GWC2_42_6]|nr:MAG: UDP-4-keto-6-deoxy-N-acetylglucosamine 4-aminotransferase [Parcubacteria group bacterium GW2011_GWA2_42_11]KKS68119.1 MAG: UDP-4-keto-6-deoxy-N-acetylglucosamine 4-aminotransferase [Parcubacteria group bacterium GW2011_GWC2_42_6]